MRTAKKAVFRLLGSNVMWLFKNRRFGGIYHLHHLGGKNGGTRITLGVTSKPKHAAKESISSQLDLVAS
jgi:hypothetical protein